MVPVSGTVKLDGQPAAGVGVMFFPVGMTRGTTYYANTDQSGRYELQASDGQKGAPVGEYKVTCSKYVMPDGSPFTSDGSMSPEMAGAKELLPPKYSDQSQTELTANRPGRRRHGRLRRAVEVNIRLEVWGSQKPGFFEKPGFFLPENF